MRQRSKPILKTKRGTKTNRDSRLPHPPSLKPASAGAPFRRLQPQPRLSVGLNSTGLQHLAARSRSALNRKLCLCAGVGSDGSLGGARSTPEPPRFCLRTLGFLRLTGPNVLHRWRWSDAYSLARNPTISTSQTPRLHDRHGRHSSITSETTAAASNTSPSHSFARCGSAIIPEHDCMSSMPKARGFWADVYGLGAVDRC
jgi:hypothetical protein